MKSSEVIIVFAASLVIVAGRPQDVAFPEEPEDRIPSMSTTSTPSTSSTASSIDPAGTTTTVRSTRIPARDPGNRIVYLVSCPCQFTFQYMPVCGTDGQTYGNIGVLQCARQCGKDVQVYLMGACGSNNG